MAEGFLNEFGIDAKTKLTTPALANEYFRKMVYEPNGNMYEVGGNVREFMSKYIYGGRCMTAYNKKWHSTKPIYDFDAVSLYPSAMRRLWCVEGKPEVLNVTNFVGCSEGLIQIKFIIECLIIYYKSTPKTDSVLLLLKLRY